MQKEYYERNKEKISVQRKEKRKNRTPEQIQRDKERSKAYYEANKKYWYERNKQWRKENHEEYKELSRKSYHRRKADPDNIIKFLIKNAKSRAEQKGLQFDLLEKDIVLPDVCPILGKPFNKPDRRYGYSLDRKDPTQGYTKDNVWVISQLANAMKWDSTKEERLAFAKWVMSLEGGGLL